MTEFLSFLKPGNVSQSVLSIKNRLTHLRTGLWLQDFFFPLQSLSKRTFLFSIFIYFLLIALFFFCTSMNFFWKYKLLSNHQIYHGPFYMTGSILNALYRLPQLTLTVISCGRHCYYLCFINEVIKVQRHQVTSEATVPLLISGGARIPTIYCAPEITILNTTLNYFPYFGQYGVEIIQYATYWAHPNLLVLQLFSISNIPNFYILIFFAILIAAPPYHHTLIRCTQFFVNFSPALHFFHCPSFFLCLSVVEIQNHYKHNVVRAIRIKPLKNIQPLVRSTLVS